MGINDKKSYLTTIINATENLQYNENIYESIETALKNLGVKLSSELNLNQISFSK